MAHARELTKAPHLQGPVSKVTARLSDFSGDPTIGDNAPTANPRGMAIRFYLTDGSSTDLAAVSFNGFPVSTTDELRDLDRPVYLRDPRLGRIVQKQLEPLLPGL